FQYLACVGMIALLVGIGANFVKIFHPAAPRAVATVLLLGLTVLDWRQCRMYRGLDALWTTNMQRNPRGWLAYTNHGADLVERGEVETPLKLFEQALAIRPDDPETNADIAIPLARLGKLTQAEDHARRAVLARPQLASGHANLALVLAQAGRTGEALA